MPLPYSAIEIFTSEETRYQGKPLTEAVVQYVRGLKIAARCLVVRGIEGSYENGEIATQNILTLSFNMPLKIEIVLPSPEVGIVVPVIEEMVSEGIVTVREMEMRSHKTRNRLLPRHFRVRDLMTPSPRTVTRDTSLKEVAELLLTSVFSGVPVVDEKDRPIGVITRGDLLSRADIPMRLGLVAAWDRTRVDEVLRTLALRKAEEIMTAPVVCIHEDQLVTEAVKLMMEKELKRFPVTDKNKRLTGILSRLDVFRAIMREAPDWKAFQSRHVVVENLRLVGDIMRRDSHAVSPETSIEEVIRVIDTDDIQRVAVVDGEGRFLGLISDGDLLKAFSEEHPGIWDYFVSKIPFTERGKPHRDLGEHLRSRTASQVMKTDLVTVREDTPLDEAIGMMTEKALKRLPVVDSRGKFTGMISRDQLLRIGFEGS